MARATVKVSEQKLRTLAENWATKDLTELAKLLGVGESTVNYWAGKLRKSLKAEGVSDSDIKKLFPSKRKQRSSAVYGTITAEIISKLKKPKKKDKK